MNRREFTKNTVMASTLISAGSFPGSFSMISPVGRSLKRGIMWGSIGKGETILEKFQFAKEAGFEGVEPMSHLDRTNVLKARDATGMIIYSVCGALHWKFPLSDPDPKVREQGIAALKVSLEDAAAYGADTVLLVPGKVTETVRYDECWIRIVDELYFDCGNVLVYGWPEQWIKILGKRIAKVHIKEYSRKIADTQGKGAGFNVKLLEGDVNWTAVMKAFDEIGYNGWTTIEQPGGDTKEGLKDLCDRLIKIQAS